MFFNLVKKNVWIPMYVLIVHTYILLMCSIRIYAHAYMHTYTHSLYIYIQNEHDRQIHCGRPMVQDLECGDILLEILYYGNL